MLAYREALRALHPEGPPALRIAVPPSSATLHLAALPGSFNPPTVAHLALVRAARRAGADAVALVLSTRTVDKEQPAGLLLEDRLLLLNELAARQPGLAVVAVNRGLYVDQANLLRTLLPAAAALTFVVGFDKIVQILDPRYYADRDAALDDLFARARFFVAPRGEHGAAALAALMSQPENRRFAPAVRVLPLPRRLRDVSATQARAELPAGRGPVTALIRSFVRATGAFQPPRVLASGERADRYGLRAALLAALAGLCDQGPWDFERLWRVARRDTPAGAALRASLAGPSEAALLASLRAAQGDHRG